MSGAPRRVLVAGIGNVFLSDDGFGVEVVRRIDTGSLPGGVRVADYGIRGVHLAYELLDRAPDTLIMVDAVPLEGPPGTLAVLEVGGRDLDAAGGAVPVDAHGLHPLAVLLLLRRLGGEAGRVLVAGCRPASVEEGMGLTGPVAAAVPEAVRLVTELARAEALAAPGDEPDMRERADA
ncbi:hydrogenase maturation protease [Actinocorallia populi]|uniref:hydrogenase maturation protease n=1 Tax=Actinocorallia populi TaxID=2079200 RepID=UPI000D087B28|nr:hydrogenase maturation protease [Actinocorallia populi]